jgi:hypothetical protein
MRTFSSRSRQPGATIPKLLEISRHRQIETLRPYLRAVDLFADHASSGLL